MNGRRVIRIGLVGAAGLLVLIVGYFFGYEWRLEWDTRPGKARTVHSAFGVDVRAEEPRDTILSEWRNHDEASENWVEVASGPRHFALVNYCYPKVLNNLRGLEWMVRSPEQREAYAAWMLSDLEDERRVFELAKHCRKISSSMMEMDLDWEEEELSFEQLERIWKDPEDVPEGWWE